MSTVIKSLLKTSYQDTELLKKNDSMGDDFTVPREVDFSFIAESEESAEVVASFVNDNQYGNARYESVDNIYRVTVIITMPTTQNVLNSISGLFVCIAHLFKVEYDGWGCVIQTPAKN